MTLQTAQPFQNDGDRFGQRRFFSWQSGRQAMNETGRNCDVFSIGTVPAHDAELGTVGASDGIIGGAGGANAATLDTFDDDRVTFRKTVSVRPEGGDSAAEFMARNDRIGSSTVLVVA